MNKTAIEKLDCAQAKVRRHIRFFGPIALMTRIELEVLKDMNTEVTRCKNKAFDFQTLNKEKK